MSEPMWVHYAPGVQRLAVPGGHLYRVRTESRAAGGQIQIETNIVFVPSVVQAAREPRYGGHTISPVARGGADAH